MTIIMPIFKKETEHTVGKTTSQNYVVRTKNLILQHDFRAFMGNTLLNILMNLKILRKCNAYHQLSQRHSCNNQSIF